MNAPITPDADYGPAAYRSTAIPAQPRHRWPGDANRASLTRTPLRWGHYAHLEPWQDVDALLQPGMRGYMEGNQEDDLYINQKRWNFDNTRSWMILFPYFKWWSILFIPWLFWPLPIIGSLDSYLERLRESHNDTLGMTILTSLAFFSVVMMGFSLWYMWADNPRYKHYLVQTGSAFTVALAASLLTFQTSSYGTDLFWVTGAMAFSVFMGLIGWDYLQHLYLNVFKHDGSGFNRQTGMVTIGRRFRKAFTAPFHEFDATMEFRPGPHGSSGFALWLHHRYTDVEVFLGARLQSLGMDRQECLAFWDTLQRYMDVTQPLPELPILEQFRHLDPTTVEHDRRSRREPRRWRDMTYRAWKRRGLAQMMQRNRDYPWQEQPCILEARIDPALSIEAYYRGREAMGIHATPKGDDFDNIHRG